jgi:hypothetical protein
MKNLNSPGPRPVSRDLDLDALLHPAQAFNHPRDVVGDADLTLNEKRAILASWASDACAVEAAPALRRAPGSARPVSVDAILAALRELDKAAGDTNAPGGWAQRQVRRRAFDRWRALRSRAGKSGGNVLPH